MVLYLIKRKEGVDIVTVGSTYAVNGRMVRYFYTQQDANKYLLELKENKYFKDFDVYLTIIEDVKKLWITKIM